MWIMLLNVAKEIADPFTHRGPLRNVSQLLLTQSGCGAADVLDGTGAVVFTYIGPHV